MIHEALEHPSPGLVRRSFLSSPLLRRRPGAGGRVALRRSLCMLLTLLLAATAVPGDQEAWVCPPCGCDHDGTVDPGPGRCPACGMEKVRQQEVRNVAILLFEGVQIIDYTGPYEVFGQGRFDVYTVSETGKVLTTTFGMKVTPTYSLEESPVPDILIVPGGNVDAAMGSEALMAWVVRSAERAQHVLSVCNGAFILAKAGLLDGKSATTFYGLIDDLKRFRPAVNVVRDQRFVDNGKVITSAGLSSGIDASLHLVSKLRGQAKAKQLALHLEYQWDPDSSFARAALADRRLPDLDLPDSIRVEILDSDGDRRDWKLTLRVRSSLSIPDILEELRRQLDGRPGWSRQEPSLWRIQEGAERWSFRVRLDPVAGSAGEYDGIAHLHREDGGQG